MILEITDYFGNPVKLQPRVELYSVRDFMGKEMPGLAIVLDEIMGAPDEMEQYATLTVSFGEFIGLKDSAYIDTNNCRFAQQLLDQGIAVDTGLRKSSGFCEYPLWGFKKEFLEIDDAAEPLEEVKIIRTKHFGMKPMYPEDACVQMELLGHSFFVFRNAETDEVNVVYKRKGNTYGLIEPEF